MFDYADATAFAHLERELIRILTGDENSGGLYQGILAAPNWDAVQFTKGNIVAYENVRKMMKSIAERMDRDDDRRQRVERVN